MKSNKIDLDCINHPDFNLFKTNYPVIRKIYLVLELKISIFLLNAKYLTSLNYKKLESE